MIDSHIHLEQYSDIDQRIERWKLSGVSGVIAVSKDLASSYRTLEIQAKYPDFVFAAVGFHPEQALPLEQDFLEWESLISKERKRITAVGEVGLPHYNLATLPNTLVEYIDFLTRCLYIVKNENLPVVLHAVHDKAIIALNLLKEQRIEAAHFHWLKAPREVVMDIVDAGYYISVTPELCYRKRDKELAEIIPSSQLLVETDGPWKYEDPFIGQETTPLSLEALLRKLSISSGVSYDSIKKQTVNNTIRCYNIKI